MGGHTVPPKFLTSAKSVDKAFQHNNLKCNERPWTEGQEFATLTPGRQEIISTHASLRMHPLVLTGALPSCDIRSEPFNAGESVPVVNKRLESSGIAEFHLVERELTAPKLAAIAGGNVIFRHIQAAA